MAPITGTFSLISPKDLAPALASKSLGDASLNLKLASGHVQTAAHLSGTLPVEFTFHAGGDFSIIALNGKSGTDDTGVVAAQDAATPSGQFRPALCIDKTFGWLKYIASADVKADVTAASPFVHFVGSAGAQVVMADYHRHGLGDALPGLVAADLLTLRSAMVLNHVQNLPPGDALAFQTRGILNASLEIAWADVFTSEISGLARLLKSAAPIAIETQVGAACTVNVAIDDTFVVAFARPADGKLVVAVRKSNSTTVDPTARVTIAASVADAAQLEAILDDIVAGLLDTSADRLEGLLDKASAGAATTDDRSIMGAIADRLKLPDGADISKAIDSLKTEARKKIQEIVESKVEASFTYEYHRVSSDVSVFEGEIPEGGPDEELHRQLVGGDLASAFSQGPARVAVKKFLNEKSTSVTQAWGFTLGLNKWKVFGQDRRALDAIERTDHVARTVSRSYVGSGGYARSQLEWTVDFAADMAGASLNPMVADYQFGLHIAVVRDEQTFTAGDLETALDFAALWNICPEEALSFVRKQLVGSVTQKAEWSFHLRVNDEALRPAVRVLGSMTPRDFAGAAAAGLDGSLVASAAQRRSAYQPLWEAVLNSAASFNVETVRSAAGALLKTPALANRERTAIASGVFDPATVATIVAFDPGWFDDCAKFSRGCRQLADALAVPTPDFGTIPDIYGKMVGFWTQSHYVRTLGCALVDTARNVGEMKGVERTLNFKAGNHTIVISSNQY